MCPAEWVRDDISSVAISSLQGALFVTNTMIFDPFRLSDGMSNALKVLLCP
jgi:hypothetical protein